MHVTNSKLQESTKIL